MGHGGVTPGDLANYDPASPKHTLHPSPGNSCWAVEELSEAQGLRRDPAGTMLTYSSPHPQSGPLVPPEKQACQ